MKNKSNIILLLLIFVIISIYIFPSSKTIERKSFNISILDEKIFENLSHNEFSVLLAKPLYACSNDFKLPSVTNNNNITFSVVFYSDTLKKNSLSNYCFFSEDKKEQIKKISLLNEIYLKNLINFPKLNLSKINSNIDLIKISNIVVSSIPSKRSLNFRPLLFVFLLILFFYFKLEENEKD